MRIVLYCNHVWLPSSEKNSMVCVLCKHEKIEGKPDPKVQLAWGFAKEEQVLRQKPVDN